MDDYAFPQHDLGKFHDYTYYKDYNGFILKGSDKRYFFDENNGWCDLNGCYFDGNEQPAGWIELSSDGKSFTQYNMAKEKVLEGQNFYYGTQNHNPSGKPLKLKEFQALKAPQQTLKQFQQEVQKRSEAEQREFAGYDAEADQQYRDQQGYRRGGQRHDNKYNNDRQNRIPIGGYGGDDYNRKETQGRNNNSTRYDSNIQRMDDHRNDRGQNRGQDNRHDDQRNRGQDNHYEDQRTNSRQDNHREDQRNNRRQDGYNQQHNNRQDYDSKQNSRINDPRSDIRERNPQTINDDDYRKKQNNNDRRQQPYNNNRQYDPDNFIPRNKNPNQQRKYSDDQNTKQQYQEKAKNEKPRNNQNINDTTTKQKQNQNQNRKSPNNEPTVQKTNETTVQKKENIAEQIISLKQSENQKEPTNEVKQENRNESHYATIEITDRYDKVTEQDIIDHIQKVATVKRSSIIKVTDNQIVVASLDEALLIYKQFKKHEGIQLIQVALK